MGVWDQTKNKEISHVSIVDYLLAKEKDFDKIINFEIGELNKYSDHCFLSFKIKKNNKYEKENSKQTSSKNSEEEQIVITDENLKTLKLNYDKKFIYDSSCKDKIRELTSSAEITDQLTELSKDLDKITVPVAVSRLRKNLLKISEGSMEKIDFNKTGKTKNIKNHVPWMNDECKLLKRQLNSSRKKYQEAIRSNTDEHIKTNLRDKYFENRRNYHKVCRKQERAYWFKQKQNLNNFRSEDPKEFWNRLNMKPRGKSHNFSKAELSDYFKNLAKANESDEGNASDSVNESENFANIFQDIDNILTEPLIYKK